MMNAVPRKVSFQLCSRQTDEAGIPAHCACGVITLALHRDERRSRGPARYSARLSHSGASDSPWQL